MVLLPTWPPPPRFCAFAGSVAGLEHRRLGRNNQDGVAVRALPELSVAVVTDGCSSGASSEVGARLAAAWLAEWLPRVAREDVAAEAWARAIEARLLLAARGVAVGLAPDRARRTSVIAEYLLFSFLAAVVVGRRAVVLGAGDGVYSVDGAHSVLEPGDGNAPDYVAYALLGGAPAPRVRVLVDVDARDVGSLAVCTDGALDVLARAPAELTQLEQDRRYERNPSLLQKRLAVLAEQDRLLFDDTTVAVLARSEGGGP
jgi:serine/threonine protein phosphatase PrpC